MTYFCTDIISPPQPVNATLNGVAKFICTYVGDIVRWEANGQKIFDGQDGYQFTDVPVTPPSAMSTLTVVTSLDKNNTNITCTAINLDLSTSEKEPALLLLQGIMLASMHAVDNFGAVHKSSIHAHGLA